MFQKQLSGKTETTADSAPGWTPEANFFRTLGQTVRSHKLGDLLVASHLLTPEQLDKALAEQEKSKEPLGKILLRHGSLTAVQLYQKLAEQWCLKAATAGMTILMQTAVPTLAQADELDEDTQSQSVSVQFTLASASSRAQFRQYPELFGTQETRSDDITAFKKWTAVMHRFEGQMKSVLGSAPRVMMWKAEINRLRSKSQREQIEGINAYLNKVPYVEDIDNYGKTDYWATPIEFLTKGGDCEDFAIAKYASLRALGFSSDQLRVAIVNDKVKGIPHAILVVYTDEGSYVLDNQDKAVEPMLAVSRYEPIFSINSTSWWRHHA